MDKRYEPHLIGDYVFDETASALQKSIRRGLEYESCWWGFIIHQSGYGQYLWRRLNIITAEDVGLGNPSALILVSALQQSWLLFHKHDKAPTLDKYLLCCQAILHLCRSPKSREADSLTNLIEENYKSGKRLAVAEYALDSHCEKGRQRWGSFGNRTDGKEKKRLDMWFKVWSYIENQAYPDKWIDELKSIWYGRTKEGKP
ncbi:hypothetical protein M1271_05740 [Patescibacteria group bacterium]|nr:hypothetical protein [Patescibacteria group bacterium]